MQIICICITHIYMADSVLLAGLLDQLLAGAICRLLFGVLSEVSHWQNLHCAQFPSRHLYMSLNFRRLAVPVYVHVTFPG